jgi:DNA-binding transcriptional ArsR family regulator
MLYIVVMDAFHALAEPRRRRVVEILAHRGKLSASQICDEFDVTPQAISQHLRVLREANVIQMERRAQRRLYTFNPQSTNRIQVWAADMAKLWNRRLDRIDKMLKEEEV